MMEYFPPVAFILIALVFLAMVRLLRLHELGLLLGRVARRFLPHAPRHAA